VPRFYKCLHRFGYSEGHCRHISSPLCFLYALSISSSIEPSYLYLMKLLLLQFSTASSHYSARCTYFAQHLVLKHSQPVSFPHRKSLSEGRHAEGLKQYKKHKGCKKGMRLLHVIRLLKEYRARNHQRDTHFQCPHSIT
jgi:hypothetical protein